MKNKLEKIKKDIIDKFCHFLTKRYLKKKTHGIGKLVKEEDKIVCYVEQKKLNRKFRKGNNKYYKYDMKLYGPNIFDEGISKLLKYYNYNKPFYYIFDNITFEAPLKIDSSFINIIFKNCKFNKNVKIECTNEITFENNTYIDQNPIYTYGNCFFTGRAKKINFINDNFINSKEKHPCKFGIDIEAEEILIENSTLRTSSNGEISIKGKTISIFGSYISGKEVYIDSKNLHGVVCIIRSTNGVSIDAEKRIFRIFDIESPNYIFNNEKHIEDSKIIHSDSEKELEVSRKKLIYKLKKIRNMYNQINEENINKYKEELNQTSIKQYTLK